MSAADETLPAEGTGGSARPDRDSFEHGDVVGRYVVLERLGAGGMGVVFAAYDPELDRKVALKLLHPEARHSNRSAERHARLLREAQAMARLSHPSVITVHDVGEIAGSVFIAMELVDGTTLAEWMSARDRTWREIVDIFARAGQGLHAAHAAGLVHRDFKPDNVLVGRDGRVRVMDFGLARAQAMGESIAERSANDEAAQLGTPLTQTGAVLGTPAYMAPEQHLGQAVDARTDQFAFCVALYEALFGERPFAGESRAELMLSVTAGEIRDARAGTNVPGWLRGVVLRGLAPEPPGRYPSMDALLGELGGGRVTTRNRVLIAAGVVGLAGLWLAFAPTSEQRVCHDAESRLIGIWDDDRRIALERSFRATRDELAADAWAGVETLVGDYASAWTAMHKDACEATHVRGEQSGGILDLRMACLDRRRTELDAVLGHLALPDPELIENAVQAASELTPLAVCADAARLSAPVPLPDAADTRRDIDEVRHTLARAKASVAAGRLTAAEELVPEAIAAARALDYLPLVAEALLQQGVLASHAGDYAAAAAALDEAIDVAAIGKHDAVAAEAWIRLAFVVGVQQGEHARGRRWIDAANAAVVRAGNHDDLLGPLLMTEASLLTREARYAEARDRYEQAREVVGRSLGPDHPRMANLLAALSRVELAEGRLEQALAAAQRSFEIERRSQGEMHPRIVTPCLDIGAILRHQARYEEAGQWFDRALALVTRHYGPRHPAVAVALNSVAANYELDDDLEAARATFERVLVVLTWNADPNRERVAGALQNLANVLLRQGERGQAERLYQRARDEMAGAVGESHPKMANLLHAMGRFANSSQEWDRALAYYTRALAIYEQTFDADHPAIGEVLHDIGYARLGRGESTAAVETLHRALWIRERSDSEPIAIALTRWALAESLRANDPADEHAVAHALAAREVFVDAGESAAHLVRHVDGWLGGARRD